MSISRRALYEAGEPFGDSCTVKKVGGGRIYGGGGGGGGTSTQVVDLPEWAKAYAKDVLAQTKEETGKAYEPYTGQRVAGFSPLQQQAQQAAASLRVAPQIGQATGFARQAGAKALSEAGKYRIASAGDISSLRGAGAQYMDAAAGDISSLRNAGAQLEQKLQPGIEYGMGAGAQLEQKLQPGIEYGMGAGERLEGKIDPALQASLRAGERLEGIIAPGVQAAMGAGQRLEGRIDPALQAALGAGAAYGQMATDPSQMAAYMSPYMQNVVDIEKREAQRQADIAATGRGAQAVRAGAFGGSRQAILEAEAQRNLQQQLGDIQARGLQSAFERAQQAQQFGADVGLRGIGQGLQAQQAAAQLGLSGIGQGLQAQQAAAQLGLSGLGQGLQAQQAAAQLGLSGVGQSMQAQQAAADLGLRGVGQSMQAQQAAADLGLRGTQAALAGIQFGADLGLRGTQAALAGTQFGSDLGLRGAQAATQAAQTLGGLGATQFGQQKDIIGIQAAAGKERQALEQQRLSQQYQDFLRQQQFPYQQLGFFADMVRGVPVGQTATTIYNQPQESLLPSLIGAGGAFMSSKYGPFAAEGGEIKYAAGQSVVNPLRSLGEMYDSPGMSADQLKAIIASPQQSDEAKAAAMRMLGQMQRADSEAQAAATQQVLMDDMVRGPARGLDDAAAMSPEIDAMYSDDPAMMSRGGLTSFQSGTEVDAEAAQRQADREALLSGIRKPAAAAYDILTLPVRGVAGAFESAVTRPLRALGVDVPYLPESFYGGDRTSMTPMYDQIRREEEAAQAAAQTITPQDPATTPTADDYMVTGEGSARVAAEDAAAATAPAELVAPKLRGISELGQGSATAMSNLRDLLAQQDEEAKVDESEKRRRWMFNLFANIAKTKTTRKGFGAAVESIANGFASMPAYEAEQEKIEREQRRVQQERAINLARIDVAIAQNRDQMAMQAQQYQNTLDLQYKQLEALRENNLAKLQSAYAKIAQDSKKLGVDMFTALNRAAADRAEAAGEIEGSVAAQQKRKEFINNYGEQSGDQMYQDWLNKKLSGMGFVDTSMLAKFLGVTTTASEQKPMSVSEALAKAPAKQ